MAPCPTPLQTKACAAKAGAARPATPPSHTSTAERHPSYRSMRAAVPAPPSTDNATTRPERLTHHYLLRHDVQDFARDIDHLLDVLALRELCAPSSANAKARASSSAASGAKEILARTFPLTCTAMVTVASTHLASSHSTQA